MSTKGFLRIGILVCAMFAVGIACITAVKGDEPGPPLAVDPYESPASLSLVQDIECRNRFFYSEEHQSRWSRPAPGLVAQVLENPAAFRERWVEGLIICESYKLSDLDELKYKLIDRTRRLVNVTRESNKSDDQNRRLLYEEREKFRSHIKLLEGRIDVYRNELTDSKDLIQRADVIIRDYSGYLGDLDIQMASQQVDDETRSAIVGVSITLQATFAEFDRIFGGPRPPGTSLSETISTNWITFGTLADMGRFGNKIIMVRHALYRGMPEDLNTLKSLTISIIEPQSEAQHEISLEGLREFPDLDLVVLDAPSSLEAKPLPLGSIDHYRTQLVSHVYPDENALFSQLVQVRPMPNDIVLSPSEKWINYSSDDFMYVSGRIVSGDSGGPLVLKENGERKIVGFISHRFLTNYGGGIAVKASRLLDKFRELESQRPQ